MPSSAFNPVKNFTTTLKTNGTPSQVMVSPIQVATNDLSESQVFLLANLIRNNFQSASLSSFTQIYSARYPDIQKFSKDAEQFIQFGLLTLEGPESEPTIRFNIKSITKINIPHLLRHIQPSFYLNSLNNSTAIISNGISHSASAGITANRGNNPIHAVANSSSCILPPPASATSSKSKRKRSMYIDPYPSEKKSKIITDIESEAPTPPASPVSEIATLASNNKTLTLPEEHDPTSILSSNLKLMTQKNIELNRQLAYMNGKYNALLNLALAEGNVLKELLKQKTTANAVGQNAASFYSRPTAPETQPSPSMLESVALRNFPSGTQQ